MIKFTICIISLSLIMTSCQRTVTTEEELVNYINKESNGLQKKKVFDKIQITVTYLPSELFMMREFKNEFSIIELDSLKNKFNSSAYFLVAFSNDNKELLDMSQGYSNYSNLLNVLSFELNDYVQIFTNLKDTIYAETYMSQRTFGMSNANSILFAFSRNKIFNAAEIQFCLKEFGFNTGNIVFNYETSRLKEIPIVEWENYKKY